MGDSEFLDRLDEYFQTPHGEGAAQNDPADEPVPSISELSALAASRIDEFAGSSADRARALLEEAWREYEAGRFEQALKIIESALITFVRGGAVDKAGIATAFYSAAYIHIENGSFEEALKALDDSEMWRDAAGAASDLDSGESVQKYMILKKRAAAHCALKEYAGACEDMRLALIEILKARGLNDPAVADYYCCYGRYLLEADRYEEAFRQLNGAISVYEGLIEKHGYAAVKHSGNIPPKPFSAVSFPYADLREAYELAFLACAELGWYGMAISYNADLKRHTIECGINDPEVFASIENTGGSSLMCVTDYRGALEAFSAASGLLADMPSSPGRDILLADAYKGIAEAAIAIGETGAAETYLPLAAELYLGLISDDNMRPLRDLLSICDAYSNALDDHETTLKLYCRAIATAGERGVTNALYMGRLHYSAGLEFAAYGAMQGAREHFRLSMEYYEKCGRADLAERSRKEYVQIPDDEAI
ncbi:MAG TPA: hypothetical protein PKL57_03865 [Candidatus Wallbacteria bacterium]|nr:hypothetical protein [Candidatus Wallbacteria bacterium]